MFCLELDYIAVGSRFRVLAGEIERRLNFEIYIHGTSGAAQQANDAAVGRDILAFFAQVFKAAQRHEVGDLKRAARTLKRGLENRRARKVAAGDLLRLGRVDRAVTAFGIVQDTQEHGRAVEIRKTRPVNGTRGVHQRILDDSKGGYCSIDAAET